MRYFVNTLLLILLLTSFGVNGSYNSYANPKEFISPKQELTIIIHKVKDTSGDKTNGSIEFEVIGGFGKYNLKLMGPGTKNITPDPSNKIILENLEKGTYTIAVEDEVFNFSYKSIEVK